MKTKLLGLAAFLILLGCSEDEQTKPPQDLPVKITRWNGNGAMNYQKVITYDHQQRISKVDVTESNTNLNRTITYTYASGKIIRSFNYTDPTRTDYENVHYYRLGKVTKEEIFTGDQLNKVFTWTHNANGTKTVQCTNGNGELLYTFLYHFNELGNCTSVRIDYVDPSQKDATVIYDNFDTHPRALFHHDWMAPWSDVPELLKNSQFANHPQLPNNPGKYTYTPDGDVALHNYTFNYQYDTNGNVVFQKTLVGGTIQHTIVYEYATIE